MKAISVLFVYLLLAAPSLAWAQSASIQASPNPCQIPAGGSSCLVDVTWSATGVSQPGLFFGSTLVQYGGGTYSPNWINESGYTFDVRVQYDDPNSAILASVFVWGVPPASPPTGSISATPNPCQIPVGQSSCTVNISWTTNNASQPGLFWGSTLVGYGTSGTYSPNLIKTGGYTFTLRANYADATSTELASVTAYATAPQQPTGSISASPSPCSIPTFDTTCSATIAWQSTNAPQAGLFRNGVLVASGASGAYADNAISSGGVTYSLRADYANPGSTQLAFTSAFGQPFSPVDLRPYFPVASNTYLLSNETLQIQYNFFLADSNFANLYNTYFNLYKTGGRQLVWQKVIATKNSTSPNCTVTYGQLHIGGGSDQSVVEVGDWINGSATLNPDGSCPNQFHAFGYQNTQSFSLPATGLNWSGSSGLNASIGGAYQQGYIFANHNQDPSNQYVWSTQLEFSDPVLVERIDNWSPDYGRNARGQWQYRPGTNYSNVVRMIFYHGTSNGGGAPPCPVDSTNPWSKYYRHLNGFGTYAIEQYMDQYHGILQVTVLYDETGFFGQACSIGPVTAQGGTAAGNAALTAARSYIDN